MFISVHERTSILAKSWSMTLTSLHERDDAVSPEQTGRASACGTLSTYSGLPPPPASLPRRPQPAGDP